MSSQALTARKALSKAFLKVKPSRNEVERFKEALSRLLESTREGETEEFHKNLISDFLSRTYYHPDYFINTKGRSDLVIHNGPDSHSTVGVILEVKSPSNKAEMPTHERLNVKGLQELLLYFLRERIELSNLDLKQLIVTNLKEWFIFDAHEFENWFVRDKLLVRQFNDFVAGRLSGKTTDFFYKEIAEKAIENASSKICFTHFKISDFKSAITRPGEAAEKKLIPLFKIFSPTHLLKVPFANDSNSLDRRFYSEFLHIIGLAEKKDKNRYVIERKSKASRDKGSLIENTISQLKSLDKLSRVENLKRYGNSEEEQLFNVALELVITWVNRLLFLKLLEAQLLTFHGGDEEYRFLNFDVVRNFDDVNTLFFQVLALKAEQREEEIRTSFEHVPYLNSSLFEPTELEHSTLLISNLRDELNVEVFSRTVLTKDSRGKKKRLTGSLSTLYYFFSFLEAYDFASEGSETIQEANKSLINSSVLGLIFEKLNGYKDGSFFTPGFITMYICRETLRLAVVNKFNEVKGWRCQSLSDLYNCIEDRGEANEIINSLRICDPAVGSGHFLVSALNEIIAIKADLKILCDAQGRRLKEYDVEVDADELVIFDESGKLHSYNPLSSESSRVQHALFLEKKKIIENCLFGVDINPNSVKICRLRLWIELLKSAYYTADGFLETLPNIDINTKRGNSLVSRYELAASISSVFKQSRWNMGSYKGAVVSYRSAKSKEEKRRVAALINSIKKDFRLGVGQQDPLTVREQNLKSKLFQLDNQQVLYKLSNKEEKEKKATITKLERELKKVQSKIDEINSNALYVDSFEWRFEFPDILSDEGTFLGFDVVLGNPPYQSLSKMKSAEKVFQHLGYKTYDKTSDLYCLFIERSLQLLKMGGTLSFITSNSWLRAIYGDKLKRLIKEETSPQLIINFEDLQIFDEATVESNIMIVSKGPSNDSFPACVFTKPYKVGDSMDRYFDLHKFDLHIPATGDWSVRPPETERLMKKMELNAIYLTDLKVEINRGILTGCNDAFILSEEDKVRLISQDDKLEDIIVPILRGRDIGRYGHKQEVYLLNTHNGVRKDNLERVDVVKDYPVAYNYLRNFLPRIEKRDDQGSHWTNLRNCAFLREFDKPKVIWLEISDEPKFTFESKGAYLEATAFFMTGEKLKVLLAIFNSSISSWYFRQISTTTGQGTNRWKKYKLEMLPLRIPSDEICDELEQLVDAMIVARKNGNDIDAATIDVKIDLLVGQIYGFEKSDWDRVGFKNPLGVSLGHNHSL